MMKRSMFIAAGILAVYGISIPIVYRPARAQVSQVIEEVWKNSAQLHDLDERVTRNESSDASLRVKVDDLGERLSKVETTTESSNRLIMGALGGIVMMLIERAISITRKKHE